MPRMHLTAIISSTLHHHLLPLWELATRYIQNMERHISKIIWKSCSWKPGVNGYLLPRWKSRSTTLENGAIHGGVLGVYLGCLGFGQFLKSGQTSNKTVNTMRKYTKIGKRRMFWHLKCYYYMR